jgi:hypothetical protein
MITYKLLKLPNGNINNAVLRSDGACIPFDPANTDYQEYLKWVAEGGVALSADEPASQPADEV